MRAEALAELLNQAFEVFAYRRNHFRLEGRPDYFRAGDLEVSARDLGAQVH